MAKATMVQVKKYFGYRDAASFAADWKRCTDADKAEIMEMLGAEIEAGRWTDPG